MGIFLFVYFINVGHRFGDDDERHNEYMIKDTALLLNALHAIPANAIIDMHYSVYEKNLKHNTTFFSIMDPGSEAMEGFYRYRYAGTNLTEDYVLERPEYFEVSAYSNDVGINREGELDMLNCHSDPRLSFATDNVQYLFSDDDNDFAQQVVSIISGELLTEADRDRLTGTLSDSEFYNVDMTMILSAGESDNDHYAYVHHSNPLTREVACRILNELKGVDRLDVEDINVFSIDPELHQVNDRTIPENAIFFELGSLEGGVDEHTQTISNRIIEVLRSYR